MGPVEKPLVGDAVRQRSLPDDPSNGFGKEYEVPPSSQIVCCVGVKAMLTEVPNAVPENAGGEGLPPPINE